MNFTQMVELLKSSIPSIVQWVMRTTYTLLIVHMVSAQAQTWATIASELAGVLLAVVVDQMTHTKYYTRKNPADGEAVDTTKPLAPESTDPGKLSPILAWLLIGVVCMSVMAGCASTEENRIAQGYVFTRTVATETRTAYMARAISVQTAADVLVALETYQDALNEYRTQLKLGNTDAISRAEAAVTVSLTNLMTKYAAVPKPGAGPTTRPN